MPPTPTPLGQPTAAELDRLQRCIAGQFPPATTARLAARLAAQLVAGLVAGVELPAATRAKIDYVLAQLAK